MFGRIAANRRLRQDALGRVAVKLIRMQRSATSTAAEVQAAGERKRIVYMCMGEASGYKQALELVQKELRRIPTEGHTSQDRYELVEATVAVMKGSVNNSEDPEVDKLLRTLARALATKDLLKTPGGPNS